MAEEIRFFLRPALFTAVITVIYWFASYNAPRDTYDWAGTVMLAFVAFSTASFVGLGLHEARAARGEVVPAHGPVARRVGGAANRLLGFGDRAGGTPEQPLAGGPEAIPTSSPWPLVAGAAVGLMALGLVYGTWLLFPGIALGVLGAWGWLVQLDRR